MKLLITLLLVSFSSYGQMDMETFDATVGQHGWHPSERGLLLFSGVHTISSMHHRIGENMTDTDYRIELRGISEDESKFSIEGNCTIRFENNYFEIALSEEFSSITKYICGFLIDDPYMKVAASETPFILTDEGVAGVKWYLSRY